MKRILQILVVLFVLYYVVQFIFSFFDKGYNEIYYIESDNQKFEINESYISNQKNEKNSYYIEINIDNKLFNFRLYDNLKKTKKIVKKISYVKGNEYSCLLPIFDDGQILTDALCIKNDYKIYYNNIVGQDEIIDNYMNEISEYNIDDFKDDAEVTNIKNNIKIYDNIKDNLYFGLTSYKGLYNINYRITNKITEVDIFNNDVYNPTISTQINQYYLVADYNSTYEFTKFYLINLTTKDYETIESKHKISIDNSYIQGVVENSAYLIDKKNLKQYEIDIKSKKVIEIDDSQSKIKYYNNGIWENRNMMDAINNNLLFDVNGADISLFENSFDKVEKIGGEVSGFYLLYKYNNGSYDVYKSYMQKPNEIIHIFTTTNKENVVCVNNYIIYTYNNTVYIYENNKGIKKLLAYDELNYNKNINVFAYYK